MKACFTESQVTFDKAFLAGHFLSVGCYFRDLPCAGKRDGIGTGRKDTGRQKCLSLFWKNCLIVTNRLFLASYDLKIALSV